MRLSTVILPTYRWREARELWRRAEDLGFSTAYTYDHLTWRTFRDNPWFGTVPTLTAAALATERIRLGTLVSSPNFRHPVPLAKELMTLDDVSDGRITYGVGAGSEGFDAAALGQQPWTPRERADRLAEFVGLLDRLLTEPAVNVTGEHFSAVEARSIPGCVQQPRLPFVIAGTGPRGFKLAAEFGQGWVTTGARRTPGDVPEEDCPGVIAGQLADLDRACVEAGRQPESVERILLEGSTVERQRDSLGAFVDYAGRYAELGVTEIVVHWPVPGTVFDIHPDVFEQIATEAVGQLSR